MVALYGSWMNFYTTHKDHPWWHCTGLEWTSTPHTKIIHGGSVRVLNERLHHTQRSSMVALYGSWMNFYTTHKDHPWWDCTGLEWTSTPRTKITHGGTVRVLNELLHHTQRSPMVALYGSWMNFYTTHKDHKWWLCTGLEWTSTPHTKITHGGTVRVLNELLHHAQRSPMVALYGSWMNFYTTHKDHQWWHCTGLEWTSTPHTKITHGGTVRVLNELLHHAQRSSMVALYGSWMNFYTTHKDHPWWRCTGLERTSTPHTKITHGGSVRVLNELLHHTQRWTMVALYGYWMNFYTTHKDQPWWHCMGLEWTSTPHTKIIHSGHKDHPQWHCTCLQWTSTPHTKKMRISHTVQHYQIIPLRKHKQNKHKKSLKNVYRYFKVFFPILYKPTVPKNSCKIFSVHQKFLQFKCEKCIFTIKQTDNKNTTRHQSKVMWHTHRALSTSMPGFWRDMWINWLNIFVLAIEHYMPAQQSSTSLYRQLGHNCKW